MTRERGYEGVIHLSREHPDWLEAVQACYAESSDGGRFAGTWALKRLERPRPSLGQLARWGILERLHDTRGGRRVYYRMPDREGVGRALRELGVA